MSEIWQSIDIIDRIIAIVTIIITIISFAINICNFIKEHWYWRRNNEKKSSYHNDHFARETIKYRFNDIISTINDEISNEEENISYADFQNTTICNLNLGESEALQTNGNVAQRELMSMWLNNLSTYGNKKISEIVTEIPFIDAEFLFYFYIIIKTSHLDDEKKQKLHPEYNKVVGTQFDPYKVCKLKAIEKDFLNDCEEKNDGDYHSKIKQCLDFITTINNGMNDKKWREILFESEPNILHTNLSSNSSDLSQMFWSRFNNVHPHIDHSSDFWNDYCTDVSGKNIHIIVDNYGIEFLCDLLLGFYFIKKGAQKITYHVKSIPMFVSDIVENDQKILFDQLKTLINNSKSPAKGSYQTALEDLMRVAGESFEFKANYFWNLPFNFSQLITNSQVAKKSSTQELLKEAKSLLTNDNLLIVKGDLNYRKLVEDRLWDYRKKTADKVKYIKSPLLIIRSYKSNIVMDCNNKSIKELKALYGSDWKTEGQVGSILFFPSKHS